MKRIDDADTTQALKLLMQEHRRIRRLLRHAEQVGDDPLAQARAVDLACRELEAHAAIEEQWLYPMIGAAGDGDDTRRARYDHVIAGRLIAVLDGLGPADGPYLPTLRELADWVDTHVVEEEQTLLTRAKATDLDLASLAEALLERQRHGALTDVDVDAELAADAADNAIDSSHDHDAQDRQRERAPGRRGAH
jgi:hypothetical protein